MSTLAGTRPSSRPLSSAQWLKRAGMAWFVVCCLGQTIFLIYILGFYTPPLLEGRLQGWSEHRQVIDGYVAGDFWGNLHFGIHVLMAAILTFGGMAQLWPALRARFKRFHRYNGRLYIICAGIAALGGLVLVWVRGSQTDPISAVSITINALLILVFMVLAWRAALARDFARHERWAMRTFLAVSGVWSLRVGIMGFGLIANGMLGLPDSVMGPAFIVMGFASYLVPLALYEAYCWAKASRNAQVQWGFAATLCGVTVLTAIGIVGACMVFWFPPLIATFS
jgi:Predicted membrane protein (DUF2306)